MQNKKELLKTNRQTPNGDSHSPDSAGGGDPTANKKKTLVGNAD